MNLSIECMKCEADFDLEVAELLENPKLMVCPNCGAKGDREMAEALATALDEAEVLVNRFKKKFKIEVASDSDELASDSDEDDEEAYNDEDELWADGVEEPEEVEEEEEAE